MSDYLFIVPIAIAAVIGVMSPGPSFLFVAQTTLSKSRKHGIASSFGLGTGAVIYTLLACFGLFVLIEKAPYLYMSLKVMGGLYLFYLAYRIWHSSKHEADSSDEVKAQKVSYKKDYVKCYFLGLMTQLSNPKTAIVIGSMIMAFLPQEVPPYSFLIIALLTFVIDSGWYCIVSVALSTNKAQRFYNRFKHRINQITAGLMALLGTKLALNL